jgi:hypothetical protein
MQDLEDDLQHVIINNPIDYVAPSSQSADEIPQPNSALPRGIDSLCFTLQWQQLTFDFT